MASNVHFSSEKNRKIINRIGSGVGDLSGGLHFAPSSRDGTGSSSNLRQSEISLEGDSAYPVDKTEESRIGPRKSERKQSMGRRAHTAQTDGYRGDQDQLPLFDNTPRLRPSKSEPNQTGYLERHSRSETRQPLYRPRPLSKSPKRPSFTQVQIASDEYGSLINDVLPSNDSQTDQIESVVDSTDTEAAEKQQIISGDSFTRPMLLEKQPVEMILIDRSTGDSMRKIRIDEHMNVSTYTHYKGSRHAIVGVVTFCGIILITALVIALGSKNHIDQVKEMGMLGTSLDFNAPRVRSEMLDGLDIWELCHETAAANISRHEDQIEQSINCLGFLKEEINTQAYTYFLLFTEDYISSIWFKLHDGFVMIFVKGCPLKVTIHMYKGNLALNTTELLLGDPTMHFNPSIMLSSVLDIPQGEMYTAYVHFALGVDGLRQYALCSIHSTHNLLTTTMTQSMMEKDIQALPTPWPWVDDSECDGELLC